MISLAATTGLLHRIAEVGGSPDEVLRAAGVPRSAFSGFDGFIANAAFSRVLEEAARLTGDGFFGLHFGERFDPTDLGALHYVVCNSPTVADAIANIVRYIHVHNRGATVWWDVEGTRGYLCYKLTAAGTESQRQHNEFSMAVSVKGFRMLAGPLWTPSRIQFMHPVPDDLAELIRVFGCGLGFGHSCNAVVFDRDLLERVVPDADPRLYPILKEHVERVLSESPMSNDVLRAVSRAIAESFGDGHPSLERIGKKLGISSRTLERRLNEHGVVFRNLVSDIRRRLALDHLKRGTRTLAEIAFLLGYSEVSAFNRAFKRWCGSTPSQYRGTVSSSHA
jgi:AraC-like DNA-binding protein